MATTLLLISIAATASSREGRFPDPAEPLDPTGARDAARGALPDRFRIAVHRSPARAAAETAAAMGLATQEQAALADLSHGAWTGRSFADIESAEPGSMERWLADPTQGVPGGEAMEQARRRVGAWLDEVAAFDGPVCAITHPMIVRAALSHALGLPLRATLAVDVAPLSRTVLSFNRTWRLQSLGLASESMPS